ncbi:acyltransferase family protein [Hydrogenophaga palleronii]|uniref:acyltransferase family protein n=1 Tax=Hydrogenophaga palleronii TaxID=65655 RepID=UPI0008256CBD|nr:acyltransferase [Hydrogenophaga palleronii]
MLWLREQFELSRGQIHNQQSMEGMRGFAVFLVFLVHYVSISRPFLSAGEGFMSGLDTLHTIGGTGVDLFFVLSGYLIYGSLIGRPQPFARFMARRIQRIYPTFIPVFLLYIALSFAFPSENKIPLSWLGGSVYLLQNFLLLPGLFPIPPMITVAWSLSYEMFFYLMIPLVITLFALRRRSRELRCIFFIGLALLLCAYCMAYAGPLRMLGFFAGVLLHEVLSSQRAWAPSSLVGAMALMIGISATATSIPWDAFTVVLSYVIQSAALLVFCLACFSRPNSLLARAFCWTPLRWLGNMSYSYYLIHGLTISAAFLLLSRVLPGVQFGSWFFWAMLAPMFVVTLLPSAALFLLVERPFSLAPQLKRTRPAVDAVQRSSNKGAVP